MSDQIKTYLGVVEDIQDPLKQGRARIRVVSIHDDIPTEALPWAYPKQKSAFFGMAGKAGSISIPKLSSVVAVQFDQGNFYAPEYYSIQELAGDVQTELNNEYENTHIILFDGDQELKIWFTLNKGLTLQLGDNIFNMYKDLGITATLNDASINISTDNIVTVEATSKVLVNSPNIELGNNAIESVIKGDSFKKFFDSHTHPGQGTPPAIPMPSALLSKNTKTK
jgi:hypothetical protein